jgi:hypothetical protein
VERRYAAVRDYHVQHHRLTYPDNETAGRGGGKAAGCLMSVTGASMRLALVTSPLHRPILMER